MLTSREKCGLASLFQGQRCGIASATRASREPARTREIAPVWSPILSQPENRVGDGFTVIRPLLACPGILCRPLRCQPVTLMQHAHAHQQHQYLVVRCPRAYIHPDQLVQQRHHVLLIEEWQSLHYRAAQLSLIHISEPTRQAEISYAVFCLKKKK